MPEYGQMRSAVLGFDPIRSGSGLGVVASYVEKPWPRGSPALCIRKLRSVFQLNSYILGSAVSNAI